MRYSPEINLRSDAARIHRTRKRQVREACKHANTCNIPRSGGLPAIVSLHLALVAIELVVGTANKLTLPAADLVAERGGATMLCRHLNHSLPAGLTPQMAKGSEMQTHDAFATHRTAEPVPVNPLMMLVLAKYRAKAQNCSKEFCALNFVCTPDSRRRLH